MKKIVVRLSIYILFLASCAFGALVISKAEAEVLPESKKYQLIAAAIKNRKQLTFDYDNQHRIVNPHILGYKRGRLNVFTYQFGGGSNSGLPAEGDWRCFHVDKIENLKAMSGDWHPSIPVNKKKQTCVDDIQYIAQ